MRVELAQNLNFMDLFNDIFDKYTRNSRLLNVKTVNLGSLNKLTYDVVMKDTDRVKEFIDEIRCRNGNLEIMLTDCATSDSEL